MSESWKFIACRLVATGAFLGVLVSAPAEASDPLAAPAGAPAVEAGVACAPVGFMRATIGGDRGSRTLAVIVTVAGERVEIRFQPYVYVVQPDYWAIGVLACRECSLDTLAGAKKTA